LLDSLLQEILAKKAKATSTTAMAPSITKATGSKPSLKRLDADNGGMIAKKTSLGSFSKASLKQRVRGDRRRVRRV